MNADLAIISKITALSKMYLFFGISKLSKEMERDYKVERNRNRDR